MTNRTDGRGARRRTNGARKAWWGIVVALVIVATGLARAQTGSAAPSSPSRPVAPEAQARPGSPLDRVVSLALRDVRLEEALEEIARRGGVELQYTARVVPVDRRVTIERDGMSVREALERVLNGTQVAATVTPAGKIALVRQEKRRSDAGEGQPSGNVYGVVTDSASGEPVANVIVSVKGTALRASTSDRGQYQLHEIPSGAQVITTRLLGYQPLEMEVMVTDDRRVRADFALRHGMTRLQEVVTTATGPRRRLELGNDITVINADSIVRTQPITSVTDLLEGRVPGLVVQRTSGAPGDPARLRLRGVSSAHLSNDPIVIVDGIRIYAEQSAERSGNLANSTYATPSPIDYIDPNSIETIEVLKGPSAATLYGSDAANGVIVINTKRGRAGPPRWTVQADRGVTYMPGSYPDALLRWGHSFRSSAPVACPISNTACMADSLVRFQTLNDPDLTILDRGGRTAVTLGVSGGSAAVTYSVTGGMSNDIGIVRLPGLEVERFRAMHGTNPPDWMERPQQLKQWGATSRLTAQLGRSADISLTSRLTSTEQQRSSLERQIGTLMATYVDRGTGTYYGAISGAAGVFVREDLLTDFYSRATAAAKTFTNGVNFTWRALTWLTASADAGLNVIQRTDEFLLPRGMIATKDSVGMANAGRGTSLQSTVNLQGATTLPLRWGAQLRTAVGANYAQRSVADLTAHTRDLGAGSSTVGQAGEIMGLTERSDEVTTFGWYVEPSILHQRFTVTTGLRMDGGSTFGKSAKLAAFPKVGVSYLVSDEPFFPLGNLFDLLRLRAVYGHAGVQPEAEDRLRLYRTERPWYNGKFVDGASLSTLGNTEIRPERSTELEGGLDAELLGDRLSLGFTGYRKTRVDALMTFPLPPSVGSGSVLRNVGTIRNTGLEATIGTQLVRSDPVTLSIQLSLSRNENVVVELGRGVAPIRGGALSAVAGYPLFGRWEKPVLGYSDLNDNGVIESAEVLLGDTAVYMGAPYPNYTAALHSTLSLLRGTLAVSASIAYEDGLTQEGPWHNLRAISAAVNDPSAAWDAQAAAVVTGTTYMDFQTVSTLRLTSLAVNYTVPTAITRHLRTRALTLSVQGTNLGLRTNYQGIDPNVNGLNTGNRVQDTGVLPQTRTWQVRVNASY